MYREFTSKEEVWINEFEKLMKKAPDTLFLFVGEGVSLYPLNEKGERYMNRDSVDSSCPHKIIITKMQCDGGAY